MRFRPSGTRRGESVRSGEIMKKVRLDQVLVERALYPSREQAQRAVSALTEAICHAARQPEGRASARPGLAAASPSEAVASPSEVAKS